MQVMLYCASSDVHMHACLIKQQARPSMAALGTAAVLSALTSLAGRKFWQQGPAVLGHMGGQVCKHHLLHEMLMLTDSSNMPWDG